MKRILFAIAMLGAPIAAAFAQVQENAPYYLPKTELRFKLLIEKRTYQPGELAVYSERFLRKEAPTKASEEWRILGVEMYTTSIPDSAKLFDLPFNKKHSILSVERSRDGILLAINTKAHRVEPQSQFRPTKHGAPLNPHDYMSEDILKAGSAAKMAELTAREIYDIRASRSELSRGEADYMPKDGEQLRLMFASLDRQESILTQAFLGSTVADTLQKEIVFVPEKESRDLLFRFSKHLGLVDADDLAGAPYYINVEDLRIIPEVQTDVEGMKPSKDQGIVVNMPGKIRVTISAGNEELQKFETYAAQFGQLETLSANLFGKKMLTKLQLNPITGNVEAMELEPLE